MRRTVRCLTTVLLFACCAFGDPVHLTSVAAEDWIGSRISTGLGDPGSGLIGDEADGWISAGKFQLSWVVTFNEILGVYSYQYIVTEPTATQGGLGHFLLALSNSCTAGNLRSECIIGNTGVSFDSPKLWEPGPGNQGMVDSLYGAKFEGFGESHPWVITFDSLRAPMWGSFFAKGGKAGWVSNAGLDDLTSSLTLNFIAVPNTTNYVPPLEVPEPATGVLLLTSCLVAILLHKRLGRGKTL